MGKTQSGAVWLDPEKTSPYDFFQYWRNVDDADVIKCMKLLTFIPIEEIEEMERTLEGAQLNSAKERLAFELTKLVHGEEEAQKCLDAARNIFSANGGDTANMPSTAISAGDLKDGSIGLLTLLVKCGLAASNGEARRLVQQGGVLLDGEKASDPAMQVKLDKEVVIKKGKKIFHRAYLA